MNHPFAGLTFRHSWRPYQVRVLDAIHHHLSDQRLHVVAAPGAGKTTLGVEIFRLLEKATVVLSPTRVIRDQWIDRLADFCTVPDVFSLDWVSRSIDQPKVFTSITYQALHAKLTDTLNRTEGVEEVVQEEVDEAILEDDAGPEQEELDAFIGLLQAHNIGVLILDEAHHLRAEWWRALEQICSNIPQLVLVSLTATPPYDAQDHEWSKYESLCGPIDEEISVPELVKAGTLCAHQDFIWACDASKSEKLQIEEYDERVESLCQTLIKSEAFAEIVLAHPWLNRLDIEKELIKTPKVAIAILSFLKCKSLSLPPALMSVLDLGADDIPPLSRQWWQLLVETVLFSTNSHLDEAQRGFIDQLKKQLRASELLYKRELTLARSRRLARSLSLSPAKVAACANIHKLEYRYRGDGLRQVILTDYIRDEALASGWDMGEVNLGAWPVFKEITTYSPIRDRVGLISGRVCIVPSPLLPRLLDILGVEEIKTEAMGNQQQYQRIVAPLPQLTVAFTTLLMAGDLKVLIGTRSLLGEGWDAPVVNSLILASTVGSFMLTNQMRGRAIRKDPQHEDKISSIWHLVAVNAKSYTGWSDYYDLKKRFDTFVGLSEKQETIESGIDRLDLNGMDVSGTFSESVPIFGNNRRMVRRFKNLPNIAARWQAALTVDHQARVIPSVKTNQNPALRGYLLKHSWRYVFLQLMAALFSAISLLVYTRAASLAHLALFLFIVFAGAILLTLPKTAAALRILRNHLPVDGSLKQIGQALTEALVQVGWVETPIERMKVNVYQQADGSFYVGLLGSSFYESSLFADCMAEILAPIDSPRYLLRRKGQFFGMHRVDYHAVPIRFAVKKHTATVFHQCWCKYVSDSELIYTRTTEGRGQLLKAKMKAFSSVFEDDIQRQDRWQ